MSHDPEDWCKIWRKTDLLLQKWWNLVNFDLSPWSLKNLHFYWFLLCKVFNVWLKKYRGVIFHDTKEWCKIWRKTDFWFRKWHEEYGKFSLEQLKVSKLGLWWDLLIQTRKYMRSKLTEKLCVMTMKNDWKFEEELTCRFKVDLGNLMNFDPRTWKSQKFSF